MRVISRTVSERMHTVDVDPGTFPLDRPDALAGKASTTVTATAFGSVIVDVTGVRVRQISLSPECVKTAIDARRAG